MIKNNKINSTDELVVIRNELIKEADCMMEKHRSKLIKKIRERLNDRERMIKELMKKAKRGKNAKCLTKFWGINCLREWVACDQKNLLENIALTLAKEVHQRYGETFHFHIIPRYTYNKNNERNLIDYNLYLCWEETKGVFRANKGYTVLEDGWTEVELDEKYDDDNVCRFVNQLDQENALNELKKNPKINVIDDLKNHPAFEPI